MWVQITNTIDTSFCLATQEPDSLTSIGRATVSSITAADEHPVHPVLS